MQTTNRAPRQVLGGSLPPLHQLNAGNPRELPLFELKFYSCGREFIVTQRGRNSQAAAAEGLIELAAKFHEFDPEEARLISALQTR